MYLYLYHGEAEEQEKAQIQKTSSRGELLVRKAFEDYRTRQRNETENAGFDLAAVDPEQIRIFRTEKGKPYFSMDDEGTELLHPVQYSVSHSGDWWGCLMAEEAVGFDLEVYRDRVNYEKIAKRFFAGEEYKYVQKHGLTGFFELWVRKEAFVKYLGIGLSLGMNRFSVVKDGRLAEKTAVSGNENGTSCFLFPCEVQEGFKAAYCCGSGRVLEEIIFLK